jgi:hypothetical protein
MAHGEQFSDFYKTERLPAEQQERYGFKQKQQGGFERIQVRGAQPSRFSKVLSETCASHRTPATVKRQTVLLRTHLVASVDVDGCAIRNGFRRGIEQKSLSRCLNYQTMNEAQ